MLGLWTGHRCVNGGRGLRRSPLRAGDFAGAYGRLRGWRVSRRLQAFELCQLRRIRLWYIFLMNYQRRHVRYRDTRQTCRGRQRRNRLA